MKPPGFARCVHQCHTTSRSRADPKRSPSCAGTWIQCEWARFGTLRPIGAHVLRSDNGLIFQSRRFRQACRDYRLQQEFITPYTPEQNGMIERFFRSLKEECVWQHTFQTFEEARRIIRDWVTWYNQERPHQALGYRSPVQYRAQQVTQVA